MEYDVAVVGAGAGGLVVASGSAKAGKSVALIERGSWGGDCTNFGCIPSKRLIALSKTHENNVFEKVRATVAKVRSNEDQKALKSLGIDTFEQAASFVDSHTLFAGKMIRAKQIVIATGGSPIIPPIKGIETTPYLTNETIFSLVEIPKSIIFIGGGPIGCELSMALCRLGSKVTIIEGKKHLLSREDPMAYEIIHKQFKDAGITIYTKTHVQKIEPGAVYISDKRIECEHIFIGVGRAPNIDILNIEKAGLSDLSTNAYGQSSQKHIWAIGDVAGPPYFTHYAEHQGRCVLRNILLPFKQKIERMMPRVTYTDPEVAAIGILPSEATKKHAVYTLPFSEVDRAITEGREEGFISIVTKKWSSKIVGATIVGPRAGEMLGEIVVAMRFKIPLRKLANVVHPYPTYNRAIRKCADMWLTKTILGVFK